MAASLKEIEKQARSLVAEERAGLGARFTAAVEEATARAAAFTVSLLQGGI
jgi:hypothetical protein